MSNKNEKDLLDIIQIGYNLEKPISDNIRLSIVNLIDAIANEPSINQFLYDPQIIHLILDSILGISCKKEGENPLGILPITTFAKLLIPLPEKSHVPGENLQIEKLRVKLLQFGTIPVLFYAATHANCKEISDVAIHHICSAYLFNEIDNSQKLIDKYLQQKKDIKIEENSSKNVSREVPWKICIF